MGRALRYCNYVPTWQTLTGWATQLTVNVEDLAGSKWEHAASAAFPLPTHSRVMYLMAMNKHTFKPGTLAADHSVKLVIGRIKGTVEEVMKKKEKLTAEVRKGKVTGVSTSPLDATMERRQGSGRGGRGGERRCTRCSESKGVIVLQKICGGEKWSKGNGPHTKAEYMQTLAGDAVVGKARADRARAEQ